ncbi:hypothetical protein BAY59_08305 [Prauserella coralliicola]|nr:hypothetical protein BAY59_08305 [Prauserella coralliicola]
MAETPTTEPRTRWSAVAAVSLGVVLVALDMTVVAVALPALGADLGAEPALTQWVLLAYSLPLFALSVPAGRWLDRAGPLPAFVLAVSGFGVASVLIAVAPTMGVLLLGRAVQGVFGSLVNVVAMPIVAASVRPQHRARAMSIVLTLIPLSGVAGPALGGLLADAYGWRSVFLLNVPIVLAAVWAGVRAIPSRLPGREGLPRPDLRFARETFVLGLAGTALFLTLDLLGRSAGAALPALLGAVTVVALAAYVRLPESRPVRGLLTRRTLRLPFLALPLILTGVGALNFLVPYFLTEVRHASPARIGVVLLALSAGMAVSSPIAGVLADRVGNRPVAFAGTVVVLAGTVSLLFTDGDTSGLDLALRLALVGVGNGLFAGPNAATVLAHTPPELMGTSSGISALLRTLGFALGPALGAMLWTSVPGAAGGFTAGMTVVAAGAVVATTATAWSLRQRDRRVVSA